MIGDYIAGGNLRLLWPITSRYYGLSINIKSTTSVTIELALFIIAVAAMLKTKDISRIVKPRLLNLLLTIPVITVLLPALLGFPLKVPTLLLLPHLAYTILFSISILSCAFPTNPKPRTRAQTR